MRKKRDYKYESRKQKVERQNAELNKLRDETDFEKGDFLALMIAALTTIVPVVIVMLILYYIISMLIFG